MRISRGLTTIFGVAVLAATLHSAELGKLPADPIKPFSLKDFRGKAVALDDFRESKLLVVAFLGTECPLAKLTGPKLQALATEFEPKGVVFVGINANSQDSITELAAYARIHEIKFPLLKDPGAAVADLFAAERTPEVFVLDAERRVRYRGRVDDQYGIGTSRAEPTRRDLKLALEELLAGKPVSEPRTEASGCLIGRTREAPADSKVTYGNQISRLLAKRCVECHREGEIAPFSLTKYEDAAGWAEMIDEVVSQERMPPWHADPKHGKFAEDRRLTADEKKLIHDWVAAGAPQGDLSQAPELPKPPAAGWQLPRTPDAIVAMAEKPYQVPAEGTVRYQFFSADPGFKEDKWVSAVEVVPGNRAVVHHVLVFARAPLGSGENGIDETRGFLASYVPGLRAAPYRSGMAKKITAGSRLIFQVHYTPNGSPQTDISKIGLCFADPKDVHHEIHTSSAVDRQLQIPPGDDDHQEEAYSQSVNFEVELLGMAPHMHVRGKSFRYEAVLPDGTKQTLLDVPHYDFNWQTAYRLAEPLKLPAGTRLHCTAHYDNSEKNLSNPDPKATVRWGPQTWDEMMIGYFDVAIPRDPSTAPAGEKGDALALTLLMKRLDKNGDGKITRDETPEKHLKLFDRLDVDHSNDVNREELAPVLSLLPDLK